MQGDTLSSPLGSIRLSWRLVRPSVGSGSPSGLRTAISWYSNRVTWLTPNVFCSFSLNKVRISFRFGWSVPESRRWRCFKWRRLYGSKTGSELVEINQRSSGQFVDIRRAELLINSDFPSSVIYGGKTCQNWILQATGWWRLAETCCCDLLDLNGFHVSVCCWTWLVSWLIYNKQSYCSTNILETILFYTISFWYKINAFYSEFWKDVQLKLQWDSENNRNNFGLLIFAAIFWISTYIIFVFLLIDRLRIFFSLRIFESFSFKKLNKFWAFGQNRMVKNVFSFMLN